MVYLTIAENVPVPFSGSIASAAFGSERHHIV
jgi:hypothetical protein